MQGVRAALLPGHVTVLTPKTELLWQPGTQVLTTHLAQGASALEELVWKPLAEGTLGTASSCAAPVRTSPQHSRPGS